MINNLELIKPLLTFNNEDDFYYLQILKRKKDLLPDEEIIGKNNNARTIKNYYINSVEYLEKKMPEIIKLCETFNARASIRLNKRSYRKVGFRTLQKIADTMSNGEFSHLRNTYSKACGTGNNAGKNKTWILDIDEPWEDVDMGRLGSFLKDLQPYGHKIIEIIPSKSGFHIISKPFNVQDFKNEIPEIDIHKDNPTNLYIP